LVAGLDRETLNRILHGSFMSKDNGLVQERNYFPASVIADAEAGLAYLDDPDSWSETDADTD
jgi:hypothetical protein